MNGKGTGPERGRNLKNFRDNYDAISWRRPTAPPTHQHTDEKKQQSKEFCRQKDESHT